MKIGNRKLNFSVQRGRSQVGRSEGRSGSSVQQVERPPDTAGPDDYTLDTKLLGLALIDI